jgi:ABC-type uncharacterized transport system fused permease/ATPase subunit
VSTAFRSTGSPWFGSWGRSGTSWPPRSAGRFLFVLLIVFLFGINGLNVINSYVARDFMTAIEHRDRAGFIWEATVYVGVFAASTLVAVLYRFSEERLALLWREWLTRRLLERYLAQRAYHHLEARAEIANPDQRIADDTRAFTTTTLSFVLMSLNASFTVVAFAGVLWSISVLLFGVAVVYAALGSLLTVLLGRPLVWLNYKQLDKEATLRSDLIHVRQHAESVALLRREGRLGARLLRRLDVLTANWRRIIAVNRNLAFFTTGYNYMIQIIPEKAVGEPQIRDVLRTLGIEELLGRAGGLDVEKDWGDVFSLGEQQLLAAARVLLAAPPFVFLDRVGTALAAEQVAPVLKVLSEKAITYIVFERDGEDAGYYDALLDIAGDGTWQWKSLREPHASEPHRGA